MLGLFFMSVGMGIDGRTIAQEPLLIAASVLGLLSLKAAINIGLCLLWRLPRHHAIEAGLLLAQAGEFAFIVVGLAAGLGLLPQSTGQFMLIVTGLTMLLTPALAHTARRLGAWVEKRAVHEVAELVPVPDIENHVVLAGFGRVGRMIASVLDREGIPYLAIDHDPITAERAGAEGRPVRFGDASRLEVLRAAHVEYASALVITIGSEEATEELTKRMRQAAPQVPLYARARNSVHAQRLMNLGATGAIPETVEGSLQLAGRVLSGYGLEDEAVQRRLQLERCAIEQF